MKVSKAGQQEQGGQADDADSDGDGNGPFSGSPRSISARNNTIFGHKVFQVRLS